MGLSRGIEIMTFLLAVSCSGLAKTILQGTVKGGRRQGRQKKRLEDNMRKWTGLEFAKSQRAVEHREKWTLAFKGLMMIDNDD